MKPFLSVLLIVIALLGVMAGTNSPEVYAGDENADPYLAYEDIDSPGVLDWIQRRNTKTVEQLQTDARFDEYRNFILEQLNAEDRLVIPSIYRDTDVVLNFWRDARHPQGIIRSSTLNKFFAGEPGWETVIDLDDLSQKEGKTWVYGGTSRLFGNYRHVMIALSDGGKDAVEYREFDYGKGEFVNGGFHLDESKSNVTWYNRDTLLVSDAFSEDDRTDSGYPQVVRLWKRGTPFSEAEELFRCEKSDMLVATGRYTTGAISPLFVVVRQIDFFTKESFIYDGEKLEQIKTPNDASLLGFHKGYAFLWLKSDWRINDTVYPQDSLVYFPSEQLVTDKKDIRTLYEPSANMAFQDVDITDEYIYISVLEDVKTRVDQYWLEKDEWKSRRLPLGELETAGLVVVPRTKGFVLFVQSGFTRPPTLYKLDEKTFESKAIQSLPERFDPELYMVEQHFAESADGTRVPYFMTRRKDIVLNGNNPVLQYGYGGFLSSVLPGYSPIQEHCWLRDGGIYVSANIRGGNEYGPDWHRQALKTNRKKAFEDFIAVSEDLIRRGYTKPELLGIEGGSNGGLLTGAVMTMRPDLYGAAVISVPLLDMLRYHLLPPGASWMGEYGDPDDPEERAALESYSPYQNLRKGASYPSPFLVTSTKDDRVHPGHARKFGKRLEEFGNDFYYYEELDGGHSGNANAPLAAKREAMKWVYLHQRLMPQEK